MLHRPEQVLLRTMLKDPYLSYFLRSEDPESITSPDDPDYYPPFIEAVTMVNNDDVFGTVEDVILDTLAIDISKYGEGPEELEYQRPFLNPYTLLEVIQAAIQELDELEGQLQKTVREGKASYSDREYLEESNVLSKQQLVLLDIQRLLNIFMSGVREGEKRAKSSSK